MPTPVSSARQSLTSEAARALDEAVAVARRRGHAQTTSLHAVSALLALPSSALREACARARSSAYSPRLQFRALELCFGVALDRLPSSQIVDEPPISNSLMAAIKRSQANQRRNPETFHNHQLQQQQLQQQNQPNNSLLCVKVELKQLILSILDDPVVSRVFSEAGFWSGDIKMAVIRPPASFVRFPRARCPPLFLCSFADNEVGSRGFSFPFQGAGEFSGVSDFDDNCRRIGEVLVRKKSRNPLLIGVSAKDAVKCFGDFLERGEGCGVVPQEISKLKFVDIEKDVDEIVAKRSEPALKFAELGRLEERNSGHGLVVSVGDLKGLVADGASCVVSELTRLLDVHRGRLWLIGAATSYEMYMKFLNCYPSVEKDWDLQLLPITSLRPVVGGLCPKPHSLMESFVPFGGFFPSISDSSPPNPDYQAIIRCHLCNEKYEQEVAAVLKGSTVSASDQHQANLPFWLHRAEMSSMNKGFDVAKAKDDGMVLNAKVLELQKKWNDICRHLHHSSQMREADIYRVGPQAFPSIVGLQYVADRKERADNYNRSSRVFHNQGGRGNTFPISTDLRKILPSNNNLPSSVSSESNTENLGSKREVILSTSKQLQTEDMQSHSCSLSNFPVPDVCASAPSITSVATDLVLGTVYASSCKDQKKQSIETHKDHLQEVSGCLPAAADIVNQSRVAPMLSSSCSDVSNSVVPSAHLPIKTSSCSDAMKANMAAPHPRGMEPSLVTSQFDQNDFKTLARGLTQKVGCQDEAICAISQTIMRCRVGNERHRGASLKGDVWLSFLGPDRIAKKKIAIGLAEVLYGSKENLICVDLSCHDGTTSSNTIFELGQDINGYDVIFRGKTVVDYIAGEICRKPRSVVFLENVDKADFLVQSSLSQAVSTGKFSDSHGREVGVNNAIFVTTIRAMKDKTFIAAKDSLSFSEERILAAQDWKMQISIRHSPESTNNNGSNVSVMPQDESQNKRTAPGQIFVSKRKLDECDHEVHSSEVAKRVNRTSSMCLDLNLSIEEMESSDVDYGDDENDHLSENTEAWLDEFLDSMDETVTFRPFDFDALCDNVLNKISESFQNIIGSEGTLEIDAKVMEQILAAAWLAGDMKALENWIENVLGKSFTEAKQRYRSCLARLIMRLANCEEHFVEEQAPGVCLPASVILA